MYKKYYLSKAQTKAMSLEYPIGDPTGGAAYGEFNDPVTAGIAAATTIGGALISGNAQKSAAETQANATANAQNQLYATGQQAASNYAPYTAAGTTALSNLASNNAYFNNQFNNQDLNAQLAPNYAFQLQQGQGATNAANNATGGMVSGNALQGLNTYTQNYAQNAYQNAFSNYQAQRTNIYNQNMGQAGLGLNAAEGTANAQLGTGTNIASLTSGLGNAQAASQIAQGNTYGSALGNTGNLYALSNMIGSSNNSSGGYGTPSGGGFESGYGSMGQAPAGMAAEYNAMQLG